MPLLRQTAEESSYSDTGKKNLEMLEDAVFYNGYIERLLRRFTGTHKTVVDFGAGTGEFAERLSKAGVGVSCVEIDKDLQSRLRARGLPVASDIQAFSGCARVYSLNVLEHIEDDLAALKNIHQALAPGGELLLYVPAFMCIFTDVDRMVGHYRRYTKPELTARAREAGFEVLEARYVDSLGFFAWALLKVLGQTGGKINPRMVFLYDRFCFPFSLLSDLVLNRWIGKNLLVIARKPQKA